MTNLDPYLAVYFITFEVLILLEVPIAYAMLASAFEFIVFNHQSFVMFAQKTANSLADFNMLALPAFLFVGCFMNEVGLTDYLECLKNGSVISREDLHMPMYYLPWYLPECPVQLWQMPEDLEPLR